MTVGNFPVDAGPRRREHPHRSRVFVSLSIDDRARAPVILLALGGGTGIEERGGHRPPPPLRCPHRPRPRRPRAHRRLCPSPAQSKPPRRRDRTVVRTAKTNRSPLRRDQSARHDQGRPHRRRRLPHHHRRLRRLPPPRTRHRDRPRTRPPAHRRSSASPTASSRTTTAARSTSRR